ncbi:hypothetical protein E2542_SST04014 [Spatholobus suberectus]|nr:hypothetical protein E2542_SST04014 [Spatholobus suberectus]
MRIFNFVYVKITAVKKRGRESVLGDSEKANHRMSGMESPQKEGIKKSKEQRSPGWSTRQVLPEPITKDEQEVVETLYALAGMFPDNGSNVKSELHSESLPQNSTVLQDQEESQSANATIEASATTQDAGERSPKGCKKISSLNEAIGQEQTGFPEGAKFLVATLSTAPKINKQTVPMMVRSENGDKVALRDSELSLEMGLNVPTQPRISHIGRKSDMEFQTYKQEQHTIKYQKETEGPALWPGLCPTTSAGISASYLKSSAAKTPDWLNAASGASKQDLMESCCSGGKISEIVVHKKSWKRCAAHVHISHLIRNLEVSKRQHGHYHDISQAPLTPGVYGPQKQSFNFLSLSTGGSELKVNESFKKGESKLEPLPKSQVPYFRSLQQQHGLMPIQSPYASTFLDRLPVAGPQVRLQQQHPHYYGTPVTWNSL